MQQHVWQSIQTMIRSQVDERTWEQFFQFLTMRSYDEHQIIFELPDTFFIDWFQKHYTTYISDVVREVVGVPLTISFETPAPIPTPPERSIPNPSLPTPHAAHTLAPPSTSQTFQTMKGSWAKIQGLIRSQVDERTWEQFFQHLSMRDYDDHQIVFELPDAFFVDWFETHYINYLTDVICEVMGHRYKVHLTATQHPGLPNTIAPPQPPSLLLAGSGPPVPVAPPKPPTPRVPAPRPPTDATTRWPYPHNTPNDLTAPSSTVQFIPPSLDELIVKAGLNPRYTFDQFIVGPSNQFCHAACQAIATRPAQSYNPMFLYGGVGLGKTHLLHAVGIELLRHRPQWRIAYVSAEGFMNALIESLKNRDTDAFRTKYRDQCDLLLVDDIQFIAGKTSTQEEFFHTFNALYQAHKQIVITSDKPPQDLPGLEERLRSRFGWGLIADIQPPEIETRVAIVQTKAEAEGIQLSDAVAMFLAAHIRSNVRELEGGLIRLKAYASLYNKPISIDLARKQLKDLIAEDLQHITMDTILNRVAAYYKIRNKDLIGPRRHRAVSHPRHIAMFLARKHTDHSYVEIGKIFGGRDHTTVMNAVNKIDKSIKKGDDELVDEIQAVEQTLLSQGS